MYVYYRRFILDFLHIIEDVSLNLKIECIEFPLTRFPDFRAVIWYGTCKLLISILFFCNIDSQHSDVLSKRNNPVENCCRACYMINVLCECNAHHIRFQVILFWPRYSTLLSK